MGRRVRLLAALLPLGDGASLRGFSKATAADVAQGPLRAAQRARWRSAARGAAVDGALVGVLDAFAATAASEAADARSRSSIGADPSRPAPGPRYRPAAATRAAFALCLLRRADGASGRGSLRRCAASGGPVALLLLLSLPIAALIAPDARQVACHAAALVLVITALGARACARDAEHRRWRDALLLKLS